MATQATAAAASGGMGITGWLTLIFVVCKVLEIGPIATWSWWLVLSPLWIGFALFLLVLLVILGLAIIAYLL